MKRFITLFILSIYLILNSKSFAQPYFKRSDSIPVNINGNNILNPWAGGLNFIQASTIDLNMDGIKDLFVFDRTGNKIRTFINRGNANTVDYKYAAEFESIFPKLHDWALLVDFNCDNKEDIFSYSDLGGGIDIYKNTSTVAGGLSFLKIVTQQKSVYNPDSGPPFNSPYNLYVSAVDIPAISDVDSDGDLDVLTFSNNGVGVEFHQNQSQENGFGCDSLIFQVRNRCWGFAQESPLSNVFQLHDTCLNNVLNPELPVINDGSKSVDRHSGNCELCIDLNGDGAKELIVGGVLFNNLTMMTNGGSSNMSNFIANDPTFPSNNMSTSAVNLTLFPCAFYQDLDNDGIKDLIVSPNSPNASEDFNSVLFYKNIGSNAIPNFQFQQYNFLQDNMIEVGEGAYPVFFDYDNDGLLDLFIGNSGYFDPLGPKSKIAQFHNVGSASHPQFHLVSRDYDGFDNTGIPLSKLVIDINYTISPPDTIYMHSMIPTFGDMDGDGDADLIIGHSDGKLAYFENIASSTTSGVLSHFVMTQINLKNVSNNIIDVGDFAAPQIFDIDNDGKNDLIVGGRNGKLSHLHNVGNGVTPIPLLDSASNFFGGVNVRGTNITGFSYPCLFKINGSTKMFVGEESGFLRLYDSIDNNINGQFKMVDSLFQNIWEGTRTAPNIADLNNDGYSDLIIGNYQGGVVFFNGVASLISVNEFNTNPYWNFSLQPNPANSNLNIFIRNDYSSFYLVEIYNVYGQKIVSEKIDSSIYSVDTENIPSGVYICKVIDLSDQLNVNSQAQLRKLIITH